MNADRTLTAIRADAATSDAEGRRDLAGHLADFRAALLDEAALIAAADRSRFDSEVATLTATRDIVIGQRETAQRERDEARGLLHALTADLNATREKLTTAEAHCNSFQHERDMAIRDLAKAWSEKERAATIADLNATRSALTTAEAFRDSLQAEVDGLRVERDAQQADLVGLHCAAAERDTVRELHKSACAERDALRAEVAELRARPVVTEAALRLAITSRRTGEDGPRIGTPASIYAQLTEGGAVTLPAQDRAEDLISAYVDEFAARYEADGNPPHMDRWHEVSADRRRLAVETMTAALASLGAPATTPSKPADNACPHCGAQMDGGEFFDGAEASCPACHKTATCVVGDRGYRWEPADDGKPADVFAGVSIGKLCDAYDCAGACGSADVAPRRYAGVMAVLDALRVKLVAPVDPEAFAREYGHAIGEPPWAALHLDTIQRRVVSMRATLTAKGIPVTPEAGK